MLRTKESKQGDINSPGPSVPGAARGGAGSALSAPFLLTRCPRGSVGMASLLYR